MTRLLTAIALSGVVLMAQYPQGPDPQPLGQAQAGPAPVGPAPARQAGDPPSRVARLSWMTGDVAFQPATVDTWTNATLNYPLTTGDHLFVNAGARAEMHIGGTSIRLNSNSNFGFLNLSDSMAQMSLNQGALEVRVRLLAPTEAIEIDTPNGAVTLLRAGDYRVDTDPSRNATMLTVHSGQAQVYQEGNSLPVMARQTAWFHEGGVPEVNSENPRDDFDAFVAKRENAEDMLARRGYVPETMVGYQDLYAYGHWVNDPLYGWVWVPPVDPGWKPYTRGRWAFVHPWGWTWVDEAAWGFAPFHYGRWAVVRGLGWVWIPGAPSYRPVYAPALVGFIGGGGFGVSVGWFPLGPREPWVPGWGVSAGYVSSINVMHVTNVNVTNVTYVNRQSAVVVSQADFAAARPVGASTIQMSPAQLQNAQVLGASPQIVPARSSVAIGAARMAPVVSAQAVVARTTPPPAPVSFEAQQKALAQNQGAPLSASQMGQLRNQQPAAVVSRTPVRAIGGNAAATPAASPNAAGTSAAGTPGGNRVQDRMSSRPPGATPPAAPGAQPQAAPGAEPAAQTQPAREATPRVQSATPAAASPNATPKSETATPARKGTKAPPKVKPGEKEEKK